MQERVEPHTAGPDAEMERHGFVFSGTAREYFGIWIVNVLLKIVTLGIYSAWAKVRRMRYFHGSTSLAGASFGYHARPVQILIGRIAVLVLLGGYNILLTLFPQTGLVLGALFVFAVPFLVQRSLRFAARVTSWRNLRFDFSGGYGGALLAFVVGGILTWATLGLLAPVASRWMWGYTLGNLSYAGRPFACDPRLERLYGQWWMPAGLLLGGFAVFAVLTLALGFTFGSGLAELVGGGGGSGTATALVILLLYLGFLPMFLLFAVAGLLYRAGARNVALNETVIDGRHLLSSRIGRWRYTWIAISNFLATILSLGLLRPWAAIRMTRYLAAATALHSLGSLDAYLGDIRDEGGATGSEFMDMEGFDFGF